MQGMSHPLYQTWFNSHITDSQVRATMFSISGQSDAIGQITCGPMVGYIGKTYGLHMAFYASAAILSPVLGLYLLIHRRYQNTRMTEVRKGEHVCIPF
jgi:DHA3 family tetracycline resistance protein-like MFS transporter